MPRLCDHFVNFETGKLTSLARLRSLRDFNLDLICIHKIISRYTKSSGGNLLDRASPQITISIGTESRFILSPFAGVRFSADAVHCNGDRFVRFFADGTERHCSRYKPLYNLLCRFNIFYVNTSCSFFELH